MSIESNGANIEAIIAQQNSQETSRRTKIGRLTGATFALATIGVGVNAMIDETPTAPVVEAADCTTEFGDVCDGQVIVYEDPIESVPPVTNVSGVTLPNKGTTTTFIPATTTTEKPNHTTTTIPRTSTTVGNTTTTVGNTTTTVGNTTTTVGNTTTTEFIPATTTTEKPNHTTTTIPRPSTTTTIPRPSTTTTSLPGVRPPVDEAPHTN